MFHKGVFYPTADAHAHIYPGKIAEKATGSVGDFYHIPMQNVGLPHVLAQRGAQAGIDRFFEDKCRKYPQFTGLAAWHQDVSDIQAEMDDIQRRGLRGIKLHPDFQHFYIDDPKMLPVYEEAHRRGLPVLFHTGDSRTDFSTPRRLMNVIQKIPDFTCIAAHLGGYSEWEDARRELSGTNVYIDTSSSLFAVTPEQARKSIEHFGVDHTMFGTDFPMWSPKEELERFFALGYGEEDNRKMLFENFARLFRLAE